MEAQTTPTEHSSLVGGSTASRRLNCPGSLKREREAPVVPRITSSPAAHEGTALHEMIAQVLDKDIDPEDLLPFTHNQPEKPHSNGSVETAWSYTVDADKWYELGSPALSMLNDFLDQLEADQGVDAAFMIEERGEFPGLPGAYGTSDLPFRCGKIGGIWDWKFGWYKVDATENAQLMFYFAAIREKYPEFFDGVEIVRLCISQPAADDEEPSVWDTDMATIDAFIEELHAAIKLAQTDDAPIEKGSWCRYADCKTVCELHINSTARLGEKMVMLKKDKEKDKVKYSPHNAVIIEDMGAFLSEAMELGDAAKDWAKQIAGYTEQYLMNGFNVPGYTLKEKRSSGRVWNTDAVSEKNIAARLRRRGLKSDDFMKPAEMKSPKAVEDALKKMDDKDPLQEDMVTKKPSSGYTVTKDQEGAQRAKLPAERAAELGARLLKQTGRDTDG